MIFRTPEWFALFPLLLLLGWWQPRLRLFKPLRLLCLLLLTLLLMRPQMRQYADGLDLYVLLDRSDSTEGLVDRHFAEWRQLLERSRRSSHDRVLNFDYAAEVIARGETGAVLSDRHRGQTRTRLALEHVLNRASKTKPSRILLFTDGFATEPLGETVEKLSAQRMALDYRLVRPPDLSDIRITSLSLPPRVQVAEPFILEVTVRGTHDATLPLVLRRDGHELIRQDITLVRGAASLRFTDRLSQAGAYHYEAVIEPPAPDRLANNRYEAWIEVTGQPRMLLITKYLDDPVAAALTKQGFHVQTVMPPAEAPHLGQLAGARAVILNNVPAWELPAEFLRALDFFVREQGGSLLMAGGRQSFGAGGYFQSPLDPLLPVSMELKTEHRKLTVALAIVMDRSGSMSALVNGGRTKMDLANEGAANTIQLLGFQDFLAVYAVDSTAHSVVPLQQVGPNRQTMAQAVRRIQSMGGGIFVYEGLSAGWKAIREIPVGQRHVILFSDAADSEEPGDYQALLAEITREGGTVSVIALGTLHDTDAALLEDIAQRGNGRIFFTDRPEDVPSIFAQETITVARSAFIPDPVPTQGTPSWFELSSTALEWLPAVDGYNLSYLRERDSQALITQDEYAAPLLAFGQRGLGRTAAISFPLGGEDSERVRAWPHYGDFLQTLARWLQGEDRPPGLGLDYRLRGTELTLDLQHDETWEARLAEKPPRVVLAAGPAANTPREVSWRKLAPGHYQAGIELEEGELVRGVVQAGLYALPFGPFTVGQTSEWAFEAARLEELRSASALTGGREILELSDVWRRPPSQPYADVRGSLLTGLLLLLLLEALVTRTGWRLPQLAGLPHIATKTSRAQQAATRAYQVRAHETAPPPAPSTATAKTPPPLPSAPPEQAAQTRQSRFARAKKT